MDIWRSSGLILAFFNLGMNALLFGGYPSYIDIPNTRSNDQSGHGSYLHEDFASVIRRTPKIHSILEIGSRDGLDAIALSRYYKCHVFAFECNPEMIPLCLQNIGSHPNVTFVPYAVWNQTGTINFYPIVPNEKVAYNPGASSCFWVDKGGQHKKYAQSQISVPSVRLDEWLTERGIASIDLLCLDVQGAAFQVLEGMGDYLKDVKYIITEAEHKRIYEEETLYSDLEKFLDQKGFIMYFARVNRTFGDYLFVRKDLVRTWWGED